MQRALRTLLLAFICLAGAGWAFAADAHTSVHEIREILRTRLFPPPEEAELQALTPNNLAQGLEQLDPYARYFSAENSPQAILSDNQLPRIGAQLFEDNGQVLLSPFSTGPMAQAGVSERVELLEINGHSIQGRDLHDIAAILSGEPDSLVLLRIRPWSKAKTQTLAVVRSSFRPLDVELIHAPEQPVLRIRQFMAGQTRSALKASIDFLDCKDGPLIIDLREAGGGDLFEALDCAALFVPQGKLLGGLMTRESGKSMVSSPSGDKASMPVVLLTGPDTASAAEVFAAALAYHGRAELIGRPTFGKCTTQTEVTLSDGSVLRFTNGQILGPEGQECWSSGLVPDVLVSEDVLYDLQYLLDQAKALSGHFELPFCVPGEVKEKAQAKGMRLCSRTFTWLYKPGLRWVCKEREH